MSKNILDLEGIIGPTGKYQVVTTIVAVLSGAIVGVHICFIQFVAPESDIYWNWDRGANRTIFKSIDCRIQDVLNHNRTSNFSNVHSRLVFKSEFSTNSLTDKFGLVCEDSWLISLSKSIVMIGGVFGSIVFGRMTEAFGRQKISIFLLFLVLLSNLCILFSLNYIMFSVGCFMLGAAALSVYVNFTVQVTEIVPSSKRMLYGMLSFYGILLGEILIPVIAMIFEDCFYTTLFQTVLCALPILLAWYVTESPYYLTVRGKHEQAAANVLTIVKKNGRDVQEAEGKISVWLENMTDQVSGSSDTGRISDLFQNGVIAKYTCCLTFIIASELFIIFCLTINLDSFGAGVGWDLTMSSGLSFISTIFIHALSTRINLRKLQIFSLYASGLICALYAFFHEYRVARIVICTVSMAFANTINCLEMVLMSEVFPTSVRVAGIGFVYMASKIVCISSPFTKELGEKTVIYAPFLLFTALSFVSGFLMSFLPDTTNMSLSHTVDELTPCRTKEERPLRSTVCTHGSINNS